MEKGSENACHKPKRKNRQQRLIKFHIHTWTRTSRGYVSYARKYSQRNGSSTFPTSTQQQSRPFTRTVGTNWRPTEGLVHQISSLRQIKHIAAEFTCSKCQWFTKFDRLQSEQSHSYMGRDQANIHSFSLGAHASLDSARSFGMSQ